MTDITVDLLRDIVPRARSGLVGPIAQAMAKWFDRYEITTPLRQAHFIAQAAHESAGFTTLEELGGRSYFRRYDPGTTVGARLGNVEPGDGYRFRGRGIFQCTGRGNYARYGRILKLDLIGDPELAAEPETSVRIACEYWKAKGLNAFADRDDVREITRRINGGFNGLADRKAYLAKAKDVLGAFDADRPVGLMSAETVPDAPIALDAPRSMFGSREGWGAITIGGLTLTEVWDNLEGIAHRISDDPVQMVLDHPRILVPIVIIVLAALIWWWRHQRMQELG